MTSKLKNTVHELRTSQALTQQELADAVGVTRQTIIAIEKGNYTPSVGLAIHLAHVFATPIEQLFFYE